MNNRKEILKKAASFVDGGGFFSELAALVGHRTVSTNSANRLELNSYLTDKIAPRLQQMGFDNRIHAEWNGGANSFLVGRRIENPDLPTMLCYGHADVVDGHEGQWDEGRDPFTLSAEGERWYGRGSADNKGQHLVNLKALEFLLEAHGSLGFNVVFLFESGEEIGSPDLAEFAEAHREELAADVFIASDGPRLSAETPTIFLGARGGVTFELTADLREESYHSGNWGGLIRNPATTLAAAIGVLVDGHGRIRLPALLPSTLPAAVRSALEGIQVATGADERGCGLGGPGIDPGRTRLRVEHPRGAGHRGGGSTEPRQRHPLHRACRPSTAFRRRHRRAGPRGPGPARTQRSGLPDGQGEGADQLSGKQDRTR